MALLSSSPYSFTPTAGTTGTGSYNTQDWLSLLTGLGTGGLTGGASSAAINEQVARLRALGSSAAGDYAGLAQQVTQGTQFTPYTLTNALGTVQQTAPGVVSQTLTPQQQANVNAATAMQGGLYGQALPDTSGIQQQAFTGVTGALSGIGTGTQDLQSLQQQYAQQALGATGLLGGSTQDMANQLFQTQQAMVTPEQQRQQLALENRLRAQGRLGTTTAMYGGTPEQLAMQKAIEEQRAGSAYGALTGAEQMATSQQARALGLGQAAIGAQQGINTINQGQIANAGSLFNIGSTAAQLPSQLQGQNIAQAGQLQAQALAPSAQQLQQAQLAASMGQQNAAANLAAGTLFGNLASTGMQEQLTAESAAAALRGKQYTSALSALANTSGGATGTAANAISSMINQGITKVGNQLFNAAGQLIGNAADIIGSGAASLWDSIGNTFDTDAQFEADWQAAMAGQLTSDDSNIISDAWDTVKGWFS